MQCRVRSSRPTSRRSRRQNFWWCSLAAIDRVVEAEAVLLFASARCWQAGFHLTRKLWEQYSFSSWHTRLGRAVPLQPAPAFVGPPLPPCANQLLKCIIPKSGIIAGGGRTQPLKGIVDGFRYTVAQNLLRFRYIRIGGIFRSWSSFVLFACVMLSLL